MWIAYFYDSINKSVSSGVWLIATVYWEALQNQTSLPVVNTTILKNVTAVNCKIMMLNDLSLLSYFSGSKYESCAVKL